MAGLFSPRVGTFNTPPCQVATHWQCLPGVSRAAVVCPPRGGRTREREERERERGGEGEGEKGREREEEEYFVSLALEGAW